MALLDLFADPPTILRLDVTREVDAAMARLEDLLRGEPLAEAPATPQDRLRSAMETTREVEVSYTRALDGHTGKYRLRPYELGFHPMSGRPVLWAQVAEGTGARPLHASEPSTGGIHTGVIHAFLESGLGWPTLRVLESGFAPAWPVQPESV